MSLARTMDRAQTARVICAWAALAGSLCLASCSSSSGPSCTAYQAPAGTDLTKPTVSFQNDVLPIFVQSCAFSTCHGAASGGNNGVFLGSKTQPNDASRIHDGLVGIKSPELPTMNFVTPGDPSSSYVMHKLDADQCTLDARCTGKSCQSSMPQSSDTLPEDTRLVVRRWIAQGAAN